MKYLAFYDEIDNKYENRNIVLSANNKIKYILNCIEKLELPCHIISASGTLGKDPVKKKRTQISKHISLELLPSLGRKNKIFKVIDRLYIKLRILKKLLKINKSETLLVYHSLYYMRLVTIAKKIKKFRLIIEVEEIYGDVSENTKVSSSEIEYFKIADGYLFSNDLLNSKVNILNRPYAIIYGAYQAEKKVVERIEDGKIHVVYAGTFDSQKGGVTFAISAAEFLDENYHMHIIGFGSNKEKENMLNALDETSKKTKCTITYDGLLSGKDYIRFLQGCHIGLSTQNANAKFNDTSFPSKILSYMANGLMVVSARIPVVTNSKVGEYMYYYDSQTAEDIADVIKMIDTGDIYDSRNAIEELDKLFQNEFQKLLECQNELDFDV